MRRSPGAAFRAGGIVALAGLAVAGCAEGDDSVTDTTGPGPCQAASCNGDCIAGGWAGGVCSADGWECVCQESPGTCDPATCNAECVGAGFAAGACVDSGYSCDCTGGADADADADADVPAEAEAEAGGDADADADADRDEGGGTWDGEPGTFTQTFLGRRFKLHVPTTYSTATPIAVVLGFHGAGDTGSNFYAVSEATGWTSAARSGPFILIVPDTKSPYSDFAVWSGDPTNDIDEMNAEMDEVLDLVDDVGTHYRLDAEGLYAYGFSDGGLFLGVAGMAHADRFAGVAILGYGWGGSYIERPARLIPVFMACGTADAFYPYADDTRAYLEGQGHPVEWVPVSGAGHSFSSLMSAAPADDIYSFLAGH
jgi:poly(3-hydroxybutyrate) depolymerase